MIPRRILLAACAVGLLVVPCKAEIIKSLAGYEDVEITKVEPDGVRVTHKYGAAKIRFESLPEDLRKKYGFNAENAKEFREKTEREQANRERLSRVVEVLQKVNVGMIGRVQEVKDDGVILTNVICTFGKKVEIEVAEKSGTKLGTNNALHPGPPVPEYTYKTKWVQPKALEPGPIFVVCNTRLIADREIFKAIVFPAGVYKAGGESLAMWTVYPDAFTAAEGLGEIPEWGLAPIEALYKDYPRIPRAKIGQTASSTSSGTGAAVGDGTFIVTCAHVTNGHKTIQVIAGGRTYDCTVQSENKAEDIAILKLTEGKKLDPIPVCSTLPEIGENVFTLGFPNPDIQGTDIKLTDGRVSSLSGIQNESRCMQITVPVQPGNSGGPLVNMKGEIVGIVAAKLSATAALGASGALPENVNYAVKVSRWLNMVPAGTATSASGRKTEEMTTLVKRLKGSVVQVFAK